MGFVFLYKLVTAMLVRWLVLSSGWLKMCQPSLDDINSMHLSAKYGLKRPVQKHDPPDRVADTSW